MAKPTPAPAGLTIRDALQAAQQQGYREQFISGKDGTIENIGTDCVVPASDVEVETVWRIEGTSDAADQMMIVAIEAQDCGRGTILLTYGPNATEDDDAVMEALDVRGANPGLPPRS